VPLSRPSSGRSMQKNSRRNESHREQLYLQFRMWTFNVFHHAHFGALRTNIAHSTFAKVTSANDPQIMQLGLRLYS